MLRPRAKSVLLAFAAGGAAALLATRLARQAAADGGPKGARRCRVVVVGAGFGGLQASLSLSRDPAIDLTVIDAQNHHLFQPLLYQVATAALSPADIAAPVRSILPVSDHVRVLMTAVTGVDTRRRRVLCDGRRTVSYDRLVIATGSEPSYFGHDGWAEAAPGLKTLEDALTLRNRIMSAFERAALAKTVEAQARALTFVLIGGGPTGVEMAGSVAELAHALLAREFTLRARARIILVDAGPRILAAFPRELSDNADRALRQLGVEIRTGAAVTGIETGAVHLGAETIEADVAIWTAGTTATPVAAWLGVKPAHGGRVAVDADLCVPGHPTIAVIGDAALALDGHGTPLPGLAPVAKQQGGYVAEAILRDLRGQPAQGPFTYRDYGTLATIGRNKAVAAFGSVHLTGRPAWLLWAGAHILFLISFRNRVLVSTQWALAYATHARAAGLVVQHGRSTVGAPAVARVSAEDGPSPGHPASARGGA